jgi:hypothetical protein
MLPLGALPEAVLPVALALLPLAVPVRWRRRCPLAFNALAGMIAPLLVALKFRLVVCIFC